MDLREKLQELLDADYAIERELGGGGMSRVFVATEKKLGRKVVIKVLSTELAATLSTGRFEREIQLAASLQQANIVPVLTAGQVDGTPYYTMPFIEGESLRGRLIRGPFSEHEAVSILRDVARALVYAHERGIVHRDIKPDNVLLSGEAAVVTDFGIAKAISAARTQVGASQTIAMTQVGTAIGTPTYMAPEQAAGDPATDHRADIYAFGCLAFELLSGQPPFFGLAPHKLMAAHMVEVAPLLSTRRAGVAPTLDALIATCLAKLPEDRPATARDLLRLLESVASGASRDALPATVGGRLWSLPAAVGVWALAFVATGILAKAAVVGIGLPDWTVAVALVAAGLVLPAVVATWYVQTSARKAMLYTPPRTAGGTAVHSTMMTMAIKAAPHLSWQRTWRGGAVAGGVVAVGIAVVMILRQFGIGPAASLLGAGAIRKDSRLLVAQFTSSTADTSLGTVVAAAIRTSLAQSKAIQLVGPGDVAAGLSRMQLAPNATLDDKTAQLLAMRDGIPLVVTGSVSPVGAGYMVTANLVRADSGLALFTVQQGASGAGDILDAVDKVAKGMRSRIGESLRSIAQAPSLERATTSSLVALREYSRALEAGDLRGDDEQGLVHLRAALKEDSTFAMAWRKLAVYTQNAIVRSQNGLRSEVSFAAERAYRFRERLPDQERFEVEAYYTRLLGTRPGAEFYAAHQDVLSQNNRVVSLNDLGEHAAAESVAIANIARDQAAGRRSIVQLRSNLLGTQVNLGKREEVRRGLIEFKRDFPGASSLANLEAGVASLDGLDSLASTNERAKRSSLQSVRIYATNGDANVAAARGQLRQAAQLRGAALAVADSGKIMLDLGTFAAFDAVIGATLRGAPATGLRVVDSLAARLVKSGSWLDRSDLAVATAYAQLGRTDKAKALVSEFERSATREERLMEWGVWQGALGEIALTEGRTDEAIAAFTRSARSDTGVVVSAYSGLTALRLARAYDKAGQADSALRYFERLNAPEMLGGQVQSLPQALALTPRRLGELYEAKGDITNAIKQYQAFVTLWKNADPELQPQVAEIKARVARLFAAEAKKR